MMGWLVTCHLKGRPCRQKSPATGPTIIVFSMWGGHGAFPTMFFLSYMVTLHWSRSTTLKSLSLSASSASTSTSCPLKPLKPGPTFPCSPPAPGERQVVDLNDIQVHSKRSLAKPSKNRGNAFHATWQSRLSLATLN